MRIDRGDQGMRMYLIRHSITYGNTLGRYIGTTDEPLCQEGVELLQKKNISVDAVYASPLKRCTETAEIIYPENRYISLRIWQNATSGFSRIKLSGTGWKRRISALD